MGVECGDKDRCCFCCDLRQGIICLGVYLAIECFLIGVSIFATPEQYIVIAVQALVSLTMVICFLWSICQPNNL